MFRSLLFSLLLVLMVVSCQTNDPEAAVEEKSYNLFRAGYEPVYGEVVFKDLGDGTVSVTITLQNTDERFAENIEIGLYRIAQELMNNIIKHSNARVVSVELFKVNDHLTLTIEDDGKGFNPNNIEKTGNGLNNINSRAKSVNGHVQFEQRSGRGTSATIRVPV